MKPTQFLLDVKKENNEYLAKWFNNTADIENFSQKHDSEIIKNEKRKEVEAEVGFWIARLHNTYFEIL